MRTQRPLAPSLINRLDSYLLLHKPEIWSARTHLVLFYGILFIALLTGIAFIAPDDPRTESPSSYWIGFVSLISLVSLVGWIIYLLRFNVFKRYGLTSPFNRLLTFLLYFISIGTFVSFCYVELAVESIRANAAYTSDEIVKDMNTVNTGITRLEYDSLDHVWSRDTVMVTDRSLNNEYLVYEVSPGRVERISGISWEEFRIRVAQKDSLLRINDSVYIFLACPIYIWVYDHRAQTNAKTERLLESVDIYRQVIVNFRRPDDRQRLRNELQAIQKKYQWQEPSEFDYYYTDPEDVRNRIRDRYGITYIDESTRNILERKHHWSPENLEVLVRVFLYTTLILTLLLFAFRHTTPKTFFLSILASIILTVLTSLFVAFAGYNEGSVFNCILVYFIVALILSVASFAMKKRSAASGIATNLFLWMLPFIPLCLVARHYELVDRSAENFDYEKYYVSMQQDLFFAEIAGIVLVLIMAGTFFHFVYRRWYAAPEN